MAGYQIAHGFAIDGIEIEAAGATVGELQAALNVIVTGDSFSRIMQQEREVKQFRLFEFTEQLGEALIPFRFRFFQTMQMFDREKRMFIDGIAMVKIAYDQRFNALQLRQ